MPYILRASTIKASPTNPTDVVIPAIAEVGDLALLAFTASTGSPPIQPTGWTLVTSEEFSATMTTWVWQRRLTSGQPGSSVDLVTPGSAQKSGISLVILGGDIGAVTGFAKASGTNASPLLAASGKNVVVSFWAQRGGTVNASVTQPSGMSMVGSAMGSGGGQVSTAAAANVVPRTGDFPAGSWSTPQTNAGTIVINVSVAALADSGEPEPPPPPVAANPDNYRMAVRGGSSKASSVTPITIQIPYTARIGDTAFVALTGISERPSPMPSWALRHTEVFSETMTTWLYSKTIESGDQGLMLAIAPAGDVQKFAASIIVIGGELKGGELIAAHSGNNLTPGVDTTVPSITLSFWAQRGGTPNSSVVAPAPLTVRSLALGSGGGQVSSGVAADLVPRTGWVGDKSWITDQTNLGTICLTVTVRAQYAGPSADYRKTLSVMRSGVEKLVSPFVKIGASLIPLQIVGLPYKDPTPGMVDAIVYPVIAAHRGGADEGPENTMTLFDMTAPSLPRTLLECDLNYNASNSLVITHDTDIAGEAISGMLDSRWEEMRQAWPTWSTEPPVARSWWQQLASAWGKKRVLMPEMKGTNDAIVDALLGDILSRNMRRDVIVQSFTFAWVAAAAAVGMEACHNTNSPNFPALVNAGIRHIGVAKTSVTPSMVNAAHINGIRVWVYTVNTVLERNSLIDIGVDGIFSNKPTLLQL